MRSLASFETWIQAKCSVFHVCRCVLSNLMHGGGIMEHIWLSLMLIGFQLAAYEGTPVLVLIPDQTMKEEVWYQDYG